MGLLEGKSALIAGVANADSIAWGIAQAMHKQGARLAFTCVPSTMRRLKKLTVDIDPLAIVPCDVREQDAIDEAVAEVGAAAGGKLDMLVHCIAYADLSDTGGEFIGVSKEGWNLALDISAYSLVAMARAVRPYMQEAGGGSIVTLSFAGGDRITPGYNVMGVAKAALQCAVRYLAYDLGPENIRVNTVSPGPIRTMSSMVVENFDSAMHLARTHSPMLCNVSPEDVGNMVAFLGSDLASTLTGSVYMVDSGVSNMSAPTIPHPKSS